MADVLYAGDLRADVSFQTPDGQLLARAWACSPHRATQGQRISVEYDATNPDLARSSRPRREPVDRARRVGGGAAVAGHRRVVIGLAETN